MARRIILLALTTLFGLAGCSPQDQAQLQTRAAELAGTAVAEGRPIVETQAAQLAQTAEAELATRLDGEFGGDWLVGLDPGHGWGSDSGAVGNGLQEKDVTLDIAFRTRAILEAEGMRVIMTRSGDEPDRDLSFAAQLINDRDPHLTVSIHANAGGGTGTEACHTAGKPTDGASTELAALLASSVSEQLGLTNRGVFPENWPTRCARTASTGWTQLYIHDMDPPTALIETAFIDHPDDADMLRTRQQDFAQAIAEAIMAYIQALAP